MSEKKLKALTTPELQAHSDEVRDVYIKYQHFIACLAAKRRYRILEMGLNDLKQEIWTDVLLYWGERSLAIAVEGWLSRRVDWTILRLQKKNRTASRLVNLRAIVPLYDD